ncbi:MAG: hypothetical protein JSS62_05630 [Verrucomicrobia bacterium]|nr:hypothetical protein [Verrucomicrobiota bacterium]MBS0647171.1 hypothetical protein [Verrucomicrobiota bacterium]
MHFTRDPIIETIITPREGHKLVLRSTRQGGHEEFFVDMIEVISFGSQSLYRSLDKPKSFIVPVSDYEVLEVREPRLMLKAPVVEQEIKIAGGKESKKEKEQPPAHDNKQERRKRRSRKTSAEPSVKETEEEVEAAPRAVVEKPTLIPPPTTLISETISRYKEMSAIEELALEEQIGSSPSEETDSTEETENDEVLS